MDYSRFTAHRSRLNIFLNPAFDQLNIEVGSQFTTDKTMVYIVGLKGEVVLRKEIFKANYNAYTLDISSLPTGLYFLKLESEGIQESIKFIKQ